MYIARHKNLILPVSSPSTGLENWITVKRLKASTREVVQSITFRNTIVNDGLNAIASEKIEARSFSAGLTQYCQVGTGTTAPTTTDSTLESFLAETLEDGPNNFQTGFNDSVSPPYHWFQRSVEFPQGTATGNLTEVGFFDDDEASGPIMFCRQLFKDQQGDPTTITVLSDEILQVLIEVRKFASDLTDQTGQITISGSTYDLILRPHDYTSNANTWGSFNSRDFVGTLTPNRFGLATDSDLVPKENQQSTGSTPNSLTQRSYTTGDFYRDTEIVFDPQTANFAGGIRTVTFGSGDEVDDAPWQIQFDPAIPKTDTERLVLEFRLIWGRKT